MSATPAPAPAQPCRDLFVGATRVRLLGTAHVSRASVAAVTAEVTGGDYDVIAVELCDSRYRGMIDPAAIERMDLFEVIRTGRAPMVAAMLALAAFQQRIAARFGIEPGAEMRAAIDGAHGRGIRLELIDREVGVTLRRLYRGVPWFKRFWLLATLAASVLVDEPIDEADIEALKEDDVLARTFAQFAAGAPAAYVPLVGERDEYMAARLAVLAAGGPRHVLAIVGAGHVAGIERHLVDRTADHESRLRELTRVPPPSPWSGMVSWLLVGLLLAGFLAGFSRGADAGWHLVWQWIAITGGLSAGATFLVGGHALTVLAAGLGAPLTTLHPALGIGMLTAPLEAWLRKPTVADFRNLRGDTSSIGGWRHNRVARILLVFLASSLGAAAGVYIAGFRLVRQLFA